MFLESEDHNTVTDETVLKVVDRWTGGFPDGENFLKFVNIVRPPLELVADHFRIFVFDSLCWQPIDGFPNEVRECIVGPFDEQFTVINVEKGKQVSQSKKGATFDMRKLVKLFSPTGKGISLKMGTPFYCYYDLNVKQKNKFLSLHFPIGKTIKKRNY